MSPLLFWVLATAASLLMLGLTIYLFAHVPPAQQQAAIHAFAAYAAHQVAQADPAAVATEAGVAYTHLPAAFQAAISPAAFHALVVVAVRQIQTAI